MYDTQLEPFCDLLFHSILMSLRNLELFDVDGFFGFEVYFVLEKVTLSKVVFVSAEDIWEFVEDFEIPVDLFGCTEDVGLVLDESFVLLCDYFTFNHVDVVWRCGGVRQREELDWVHLLSNT